jgi:excisionase family DNA binding protein
VDSLSFHLVQKWPVTSRQAGPPYLTVADQIQDVDHALDATELARLLGCCRVTIFNHARAGRIPCFRVGTLLRFNPGEIAKWLRSQ